MRKEDMIRMHALLFQTRRFLEVTVLKGKDHTHFAAYDKLGVTPVSLHKDRRAHQMAIFLLGEAISAIMVEEAGAEADLKNKLHFIRDFRIDRL